MLLSTVPELLKNILTKTKNEHDKKWTAKTSSMSKWAFTKIYWCIEYHTITWKNKLDNPIENMPKYWLTGKNELLFI